MSFSRNHPYFASIQSRQLLNGPGSNKQTQHIVLKIDGDLISYDVGDSVGVIPTNCPELVKKTLHAIKSSGDFVLEDGSLLEYTLKEKLNLSDINKGLIQAILPFQEDSEKRSSLELLLEKEHKNELKTYIEAHELWDFLESQAPLKEISPQLIVNHLRPIIPRLYSIASSQKVQKDEIHLTVSKVEYETNGIKRLGLATHYLCHHAPLHKEVVPIYIQKTKDFLLPEIPNTPIIMVGPGTGIAPFRAFLQEREKSNGPNWLFFGEQKQKTDFYYEEYFTHLEKENKLRLDLAFSRDQEHKIYVQDRMKENAKDLLSWLDSGAILYVCGDAKRMAKDVEHTLLEIFQEEKNLSEAEAKDYLKTMRKEKRYLRDVY